MTVPLAPSAESSALPQTPSPTHTHYPLQAVQPHTPVTAQSQVQGSYQSPDQGQVESAFSAMGIGAPVGTQSSQSPGTVESRTGPAGEQAGWDDGSNVSQVSSRGRIRVSGGNPFADSPTGNQWAR